MYVLRLPPAFDGIRFGEAAAQRRRRPMLQQRDLFRWQRGRVLENYGEGVVDGDHGVLRAVVVLHSGVCSPFVFACARSRRSFGFYPSVQHSLARFAIIFHAFVRSGSRMLTEFGGEPACAGASRMPFASRTAFQKLRF